MRHHLVLALAIAACGATPALAGHGPRPHVGHRPAMLPHWGGPFGVWYGGWQASPMIGVAVSDAVAPVPAAPPATRDGWLHECRRRLGDSGTGGAAIGAVAGGLAGNVLAGRGNRTLGTVAGAVVGAVAGAAIDRAEDAPRVRDQCEAMLEDWGRRPVAYGYGQGHAYVVPVMLVPVSTLAGAAPPPRGECHETVVTEEFVTPMPRRARLIPRRPRPDKRIPQ